MLTWEYPPRIVGGISRHCMGLSRALARAGVDVHVITLEFPGAKGYEEVDGVKVYRVRVEIGNPNFLTWVFIFNHFMEKQVGMLLQSGCSFDIIHVHDWLTTPAGIALKHIMDRRLVLTMHSTEIGRSTTLDNPDAYTKDSIEWWGTYEASAVIAVSSSLRWEIINHFKVPEWKVYALPNGIDLDRFKVNVDRNSVRMRWGIPLDAPLIVALGRLTSQKGFQHLIPAFAKILHKYPNARLIIIGDGWMRGELESIAWSLGVRDKVIFTGFIGDREVVEILKSGDVMVIPSVYEPFGITALEGMAAGIPVVVSSVGGLREIVEHEKDGVWVYPANPDSIAWGIDRVLSDPGFANYIRRNAFNKVASKYSWDSIARETIKIYRRVLGEGV
ncbi:MAG TPA: glycosyltransferase family 1 protein [Thermoprotei archaeon]|nr:glycosyltransferase family 1 protein [Thermoprotei archaeon]